MRSLTCVSIIPIGPDIATANALDTLESIAHYMPSDHRIVVVDDTGGNFTDILAEQSLPVDVVAAGRAHGTGGGLYIALSLGLRYALTNYRFRVALKIDTDALVINHGADRDAAEYFEANPGVGIIGSHRIMCTGKPRDFKQAGERLLRNAKWLYPLKHPRRFLRTPEQFRFFFLLRQILSRALRHGYEPGEHCQGGAYFISRRCLESLETAGLFGRGEMIYWNLAEDHLFSMLACSMGFRLGDFAVGELPMAIKYRGLPAPPEELARSQKKIVHSVRFWENMSEPEIRRFFRGIRDGRSHESEMDAVERRDI
ncbi:MAG: glycosyltransferase family 2 protein [bacterium]|nr:glycosyltransferase family 2 protein [bacterium]